MRCIQRVSVAVVLGTGVVAASPVVADGGHGRAVRFTRAPDGAIVVPVFIKGSGPHRFVLDTGASHTSLSAEAASTLGLETVARAPVTTASGTTERLVVKATGVRVGSAAVAALLATAVPQKSFRILGDGISGVLGQDFLSQFNYTLDYRGTRVIWDDSGEPARGDRLPLQASGGRFLVDLQQDGPACRSVRLVPDSGANGVVIFTGTNADRLPMDRTAARLQVVTLAGDATATAVILRELRVGRTSLVNQPAASVSRPRLGADEGDGLLPLHLFARVSFNNRERYMVVEPR